MKNEMTPEQALNNLYQAARMAPINADQHDIVRASAEVLLRAIKPEESKEANPKKDAK